MKLFSLHPADAQWFRHWLRNNLIGFLAISCLLLILHSESTVRVVRTQNVIAFPVVNQQVTRVQHPTAVLPEGWRRTNRGWEHVSTWRPMIEPMEPVQDNVRATWLDALLNKLHDVPPWMFAVLQITAIAVIVNLTKGHDPERA
jgi:hypothetical protein